MRFHKLYFFIRAYLGGILFFNTYIVKKTHSTFGSNKEIKELIVFLLMCAHVGAVHIALGTSLL